MKKWILSSFLSMVNISFAASTPIFLVAPLISAPATLTDGETGTAVYQVTNNTRYLLTSISLAQMPAGAILNTDAVAPAAQYCTNPFNLAAGNSCLIKIALNSHLLSSGLSTGPIVCTSQSKAAYCSQPFASQQMTMTVTPGPIPQDCNSNIANFNYELLQVLDSTSVFTAGWGPGRNPLSLSPANPNLTNCPTSAGINWQRQRIIAAAQFWVAQKLNYCHHYNPDYATPLSERSASGTAGGYCNPAIDTMPGSVYYGQQARWNYSGQGSETAYNWVNNNQMWYGMDCSNTTAFIYNFALNIQFDSKTSSQAGQESCPGGTGCPQDNLSPNEQNVGSYAGMYLDNPARAGYLVCADGTYDPNSAPGGGTPTLCVGHGGYLSGITSSGCFTKSVTVTQVAPLLQPGDMLYIAGASGSVCGASPDPQPNPDGSTSEVTHVIMWLGKQVGYGPNDINPSLIAPDDAPCANPSIWQPHVGDWVIVDSHYQGYDYRVLTSCFYLNDLWGVRRVIV